MFFYNYQLCIYLPQQSSGNNQPAVPSVGIESPSMEGSRPAQPAEPGTLNATLPDTPAIDKMTGRESAHSPESQQAPPPQPQPTEPVSQPNKQVKAICIYKPTYI